MTRIVQTLASAVGIIGTPVDPASAEGSLIDLASEVAGLLPPGSIGLTARHEIVAAQSVVGVDANLTDTLNFAPISAESVLLSRNGKLLPQGAALDYTISGQIVQWLAGTGTAADLLVTDELVAYYLSATIVSPPFSNVLSTIFDGVDEFIDMGDVAPFRFERTNTFSLSVWLKTSSASAQAVFSKRGSGTSDPGYLVQIKSTSGKIQFIVSGSGNEIDVQGQDNVVNDGNWHFVAVTYDGSSTAAGTKIYVDNVVQTKQVNSDTLSSSILNTRAFKVGVKGTASSDFDGNIDEPAVWSKELTVSDVSSVYNSGTPGDLSAHPSSGNIISGWRAGDNDTFPTWADNFGSNDGAMTNMVAGDFVADTPP